MSNNFLQTLLKSTDNEYAMLVADERFENYGHVDTGSYALNALVSGSIYGGLADTKVIGLAGEQATGKTFFTLACVKNFLDSNPNSFCAYFESENALDPETIRSRGIDPKRIAVIPVTTIEEFRTQAARMLDQYAESSAKDRPKLMFVLDSLGNLSTNKEVNDVTSGSDKRDMTKQQLTRGAFRVLTLKMGKVKVPMLVTAHTYATVGSYVPGQEIGGGCLVAGTKIFTVDGFKNIEDITLTDNVLTKEGLFAPVVQTFKFEEKETLEIEFEDGYVVRCTPEHKFLVNGEWIEAKDLLENTEVSTIS